MQSFIVAANCFKNSSIVLNPFGICYYFYSENDLDIPARILGAQSYPTLTQERWLASFLSNAGGQEATASRSKGAFASLWVPQLYAY